MFNHTVIEAEQLLAMDLGGSSDPFCVISFGPQTYRTGVEHRTLAPKWNQVWVMKLRFSYSQECRLPIHEHSKTWKLSIAVYDWDRVGSNDFIGRVEVESPGLNFVDGHSHDLWLELTSEKQVLFGMFSSDAHERVEACRSCACSILV